MYRVFGCFGGAASDTILAAMMKAASDGANVISMSFGELSGDNPFQQVVESLGQKGIAIFAANGNDGNLGTFNPSSPGKEPSVFAVGSIMNEKFPLTYEVRRRP